MQIANQLRQQIYELIEQKCLKDLSVPNVQQPVGYDLPTLVDALDKLNGVGATSYGLVQIELDKLCEENVLSLQARDYILTKYDRRYK